MMASLLSPMQSSAPDHRMTDLLPTVKCSNCNAPVPLDELGDHICASNKPSGPSLPKPSINPTQATSLLPQRLQNLVNPGSTPNTPTSARSLNPPSPRDRYAPSNTNEMRARSNSAAARPQNNVPAHNPEAGMAGVGRRGFAAAAQATVFASRVAENRDPKPNGRRPYLDIDVGTPALSESSGSSNQSPGPVSPFPQSERGGISVRSPSVPRNVSTSPTSRRGGDDLYQKRYGKEKASPNSRDNGRYRRDESPPPRSKPQGRAVSQPRRARSPSVSSGSEYGGLAYDTEYEDQKLGVERSMKNSSKHSPIPSGKSRATQRRNDYDEPRSMPSRPSNEERGRERGRDRDPYAHDARDASTGRVTGPRPNGHHRSASSLSNGLGAATMGGRRNDLSSSPESKISPMPPKSARQREREREREREVSPAVPKPKKTKTCVRCEKRIEDGKWIAMENKSVLCEKCWKNMYLPKCRRCNLPIEKQAVSSSDGQLKGKYHRECFNCHVCHEPFPDKTFYVYDGKPLCAYHYHEKNESLCSAAHCGDPIEGPCAVSHTGNRYHPEHMLCEYQGRPRCKERLEDYFEIDGLMLCERHARMASGQSGGTRDGAMSSKATKRKTRYIDLPGNKGGAPPLPYGGSSRRR